jgi:CheY-like chemotaxis protein
MPLVRLDDLGLWQLEGVDCRPAPRATTVAEAFSAWALDFRTRHSPDAVGAFLIHANGVFTPDGRRQDLQGVELLKHIRLTRWLGSVRTWHALVYSFEPLEQIFRRTPGNLILLSPGVTFVRLPEALDLTAALPRALPHRAMAWRGMSGAAMLADLARLSPASLTDRDFRPFVAADYVPPDSAHDISNHWGMYEIVRSLDALDRGVPTSSSFPEVEQPDDILPAEVRQFVLSLEAKKPRFLDRADEQSDNPTDPLTLERALAELGTAAAGKTVAYIDDEAHLGWQSVLQRLLALRVRPVSAVSGQLRRWAEEASGATDGAARDEVDSRYSESLVRWLSEERTDLLILDLRLLRSMDRARPTREASGMTVAKAVRRDAPYLPILLFTASNKADTLVFSQSLEIDGFWIKPGLGEHRAPHGGVAALIDLVRALTRLLDIEYAWLANAGRGLEEINAAPRGAHWWEQTFEWPRPMATNEQGAVSTHDKADVHRPSDGLRAQVVSLVVAVLQQCRLAARSESNGADTNAGALQAQALRLGVFNRIGQVVELVHGKDDLVGKSYKVPGGPAGRVGGGIKKVDERDRYLHRRCDWVAYRLLVLRNVASHPGPEAPKLDARALRVAVCDLLAWLSLPRRDVQPLDVGCFGGLDTRLGGAAFRLHALDPESAAWKERYPVAGEQANVDHFLDAFRTQLRCREAFDPIVQKGDALAGPSR